jgi:cob(I)alamin adenosyltransferase
MGMRGKGINTMNEGLIQVYSGEGHGKSAAALGRAMQIAGTGRNVVIINFLKGNQNEEFLKRLEPEIKIFRFEKSEEEFSQLSEERKQEEIHNIKNGLNFAKKVLTTGECSLLILDEVLGLIDNGIISIDDLRHILEAKADDVGIILTGIRLNDDICQVADEIFKIDTVNYKIFNNN